MLKAICLLQLVVHNNPRATDSPENPVGHGLRPPSALKVLEVMAAMYRQDLLLMRRVSFDFGDLANKGGLISQKGNL